MAQQSQLLCDGCGEILRGVSGGMFMERNFVEISGRVTVHAWDAHARKSNYQHLTKPIVSNLGTEKQWIGEQLMFCNKRGVPCFSQWIDRTHEKIKFALRMKREESLRELRNKEIEAEEAHERIYGR